MAIFQCDHAGRTLEAARCDRPLLEGPTSCPEAAHSCTGYIFAAVGLRVSSIRLVVQVLAPDGRLSKGGDRVESEQCGESLGKGLRMSFDNWEWPLAFSSLTEQSESGNRCIELFVDELTLRLVICCEHFRRPNPFGAFVPQVFLPNRPSF